MVKDELSAQQWQAMMARWNVLVIALLVSEREGDSVLVSQTPTIQGTIPHLERHSDSTGPVFTAVYERVRVLFHYTYAELLNEHQRSGPLDFLADLRTIHQQLHPHRDGYTWHPQDLPQLLDYLPDDAPLALFGVGPRLGFMEPLPTWLPRPLFISLMPVWAGWHLCLF